MTVKETERKVLRSPFVSYVVVGLFSGLAAGLMTLSLQTLLFPAAPRVATVDVGGLLAGEIERLQESGVDEAKAEAYANIWGPTLGRSIQDIAQEYDVVLLASPAVAAGAPDMTEILKERLESEVAKFR